MNRQLELLSRISKRNVWPSTESKIGLAQLTNRWDITFYKHNWISPATALFLITINHNIIIQLQFIHTDLLHFISHFVSMKGMNSPAFYVLLTENLGSVLVNNQLDAEFFSSCIFIQILYMFRAPLCSSSGESNVLIRHNCDVMFSREGSRLCCSRVQDTSNCTEDSQYVYYNCIFIL